ncbi:unnamed protein product (macronuclear) [Paramecium tetraurelia]|uniref:Uncharacterized protein n=1 Tax=Paramecium tetraurelia TaxID=5888 RepID=A0E6J7_PARTE|nr:uncharacterized protein GSPATT00003779001 [Paramecium tetraurelia]CAK90914.1 unnamed protein product [Paramecium tetraurelia]|eukprot:XP_001458311.1 hypothetical protein (macronuclear) [Paramecium tetraurelia strain d4-2]
MKYFLNSSQQNRHVEQGRPVILIIKLLIYLNFKISTGLAPNHELTPGIQTIKQKQEFQGGPHKTQLHQLENKSRSLSLTFAREDIRPLDHQTSLSIFKCCCFETSISINGIFVVTSDPLIPIEIPISPYFIAGESFTKSPVTPTTCQIFYAGDIRANTTQGLLHQLLSLLSFMCSKTYSPFQLSSSKAYTIMSP